MMYVEKSKNNTNEFRLHENDDLYKQIDCETMKNFNILR